LIGVIIPHTRFPEAAGKRQGGGRPGADPVEVRPGFAAMLERIEGNGVRTIIVETASRLKPDSFVDDTPTATLVRQILGAISEFDKAMTVAKLRGARDAIQGLWPLAKRLHRQKPKGGRLSLRAISAELAAAGFLNETAWT
jgi:DNA invertase Pin-like site-specific DNA recombinase